MVSCVRVPWHTNTKPFPRETSLSLLTTGTCKVTLPGLQFRAQGAAEIYLPFRNRTRNRRDLYAPLKQTTDTDVQGHADLDVSSLCRRFTGKVGSELQLSLISGASGRLYKVNLRRHICPDGPSGSDHGRRLTDSNTHLTSDHVDHTGGSDLEKGRTSPTVLPVLPRSWCPDSLLVPVHCLAGRPSCGPSK